MNAVTMSARAQALTARTHQLIARLETWAHENRVRALVVKIVVTVVGPLVVVVGAAMTVLPGPGLVVIAIGLALLALEYEWARRALALMGRTVGRARDAALPEDGSGPRRVLGVTVAAAFFVATFALTTAVTTFLGAQAIL